MNPCPGRMHLLLALVLACGAVGRMSSAATMGAPGRPVLVIAPLAVAADPASEPDVPSEPTPRPAPTPAPAPDPDLDRLDVRSMAGTLGGVCDTHASGFDEDADDGVFVRDPEAEDGAACEYFARAGTNGGGIGGRVFMPGGAFTKGDRVYFGVRVKLDANWESSSRALKWMRFRVGRSFSQHVGFVNFLLNRPSLEEQTPYHFSTSLGVSGTSRYFGTPDVDDPNFGSYDVYETECILDDVPVDQGGRGECSLWLDGEQIARLTHTRTLGSAADQVNWVEFIGTFEPGSVPQDQRLWVDWVKVGGSYAN